MGPLRTSASDRLLDFGDALPASSADRSRVAAASSMVFLVLGLAVVFLRGLPAVLLSIVLFLSHAQPAKAQCFPTTSGNAAAHACTGGRANSRRNAAKLSLGAALLNWRVLVLALLYIGMTWACPASTIGCPHHQIARYAHQFRGNLRSAIPWICAAFAAILWGRHSDRRNERYVNLAIPLIVGALGFAASAYVGSPLLGIVACRLP